MNPCCIKTSRKLMAKLSQALHEGKVLMGGGCPRCQAYITVKIEGTN